MISRRFLGSSGGAGRPKRDTMALDVTDAACRHERG
jgi:hypothetical protein